MKLMTITLTVRTQGDVPSEDELADLFNKLHLLNLGERMQDALAYTLKDEPTLSLMTPLITVTVED